MSTQLRLVDPADLPERVQQRAPRGRRAPAKSSPAPAGSTARRATARSTTSTSARRAVRWGEWQLDSRTRSVGRAGVAAAREALEQQAAEQERMRERPLAS